MNDMSLVIIPRSDQINADDLFAGPRTITIDAVSIKPGTEQPVSMTIVGDKKVYRPCKSMCRVMVQAWGKDANLYAGRSLTLYCDPNVKFGPLEVGGIRISHMSHIERRLVMALTATKGNKKPFVVEPLKMDPPKATPNKAEASTAGLIDRIQACQDAAALQAMRDDPALAEWRIKLAKARADLDQQIADAFTKRMEALSEVGPPHPGDVHLAGVVQDVTDEFGGAFA